MSQAITETLEIGNSVLEVEIEYKAYPGEYSGSLPEAELISAYVVEWNGRLRGGSWIWNTLDKIAFGYVESRWEEFEARCLETEAELQYER